MALKRDCPLDRTVDQKIFAAGDIALYYRTRTQTRYIPNNPQQWWGCLGGWLGSYWQRHMKSRSPVP